MIPPQLLVSITVAGFGLISTVIAIVNLIRPKTDWQQIIERERGECRASTRCREICDSRIRFSMALVCRRLQGIENALVYVFIIALFLLIMFGIILLVATFGKETGVSLDPTQLMYIAIAVGLMAFASVVVTVGIAIVIRILEAARENP